MKQIIPSGPAPANIMLVGEAPGEAEVREGLPFVGTAGQELNRMLGEAGILRNGCFVTNVARVRPAGNDIGEFVALRKKDITHRHRMLRDKFVTPEIYEGLETLKREIELARPKVIIAFGNVALWALTGQWGITSWRGSTMETDLDLALDYKPVVVPTYHPSAILRQWSWRRIAVHDLRRAERQSKFPGLVRPEYRFIIRPDFGTALRYLSALLDLVRKRPTRISCDIETRAGHIACIGFAWSRLEAICIPLMCTERPEGYWSLSEEAELVHRMQQLLTHPNAQIIGQNFLYDAQYLWRHWHIIPNLAQDTMISQHTAFSNMQKGLDFLSSMYCDFHEYWKDEGKEWDPSIPEDRYWTYNCKDAVITYECADELVSIVEASGIQEPHAFQQQLFFPVLRTMNKGIRPNIRLRQKLAGDLFAEIQSREQWLYDVLGYVPNVKSPAQMQDLFYEQLRQRKHLNRKTRTVTCDDEALKLMCEREPLLKPLVSKILEIRSLGVFLSTYVNGGLDYDGRYRCSFAIAGAETFRFKSSKNAFGTGFNFQNVPSGGVDEDGLELPNLRRLFLPDEGKMFFDIDLNSADLRIVVWEADEPEMKAIFAEGLDPYTEIAKEFYHDPSITKKDPRRQTFKSFAHGTNYLGTAKGLAERLGLSVHQAEQTQRWYFERFPRIKTWQEDLKDQVAKRGMVQNVFGYRTFFFDRIEGTVFNQAAAWIPQSTVACLINRAYVKIDESLPDVDVLIQVHDSLAGQFPIQDAERHKAAIISAAQIALPYPDPLIIPVGIKTSAESWGDCK